MRTGEFTPPGLAGRSTNLSEREGSVRNQVNIGIMGWWHNGNEGDFRILECLTGALEPHQVVPIDLPFPLNEDSLRRLNLLDFVIVGGGGLFQDAPPPSPFQNFDVWGKQLQTPIGVAGIGIDAILPEYRGSIGTLIEQAQFFYVRDRTSQRIAGHPKAQVMPDLTFFHPLRAKGTGEQVDSALPTCGVNLREMPGHSLDPWLETLVELPLRLRGIPMASYDSWRETEILQELEPATATSFGVHLYDQLDLMIGTAFHSVVFAVQAAIPVIGIAYSPKVRRLMAEIGLERFCLDPDEWLRLPWLVDRLLLEHEELTIHLQETTRRLSESAQQSLAAMREEIERSAMPRVRAGAKVSIVIVGHASYQANHATLESCLAQTHEELEITLVTDGTGTLPTASSSDPRLSTVRCEPQESMGERLNRASAHATGDYLSWVEAGDCYAPDAVSCMVDRLQNERGCDMVFTDYYSMHQTDRIADAYPAGSASKLLRRDVVGPCFLYRRELGKALGRFSTDAPLVSYDYWLRAHSSFDLQPMHARLFYALSASKATNLRPLERQTRQQWRSTQPALSRLLWRMVDNEILEAILIRPLQALRRVRRGLTRHPAQGTVGQRT